MRKTGHILLFACIPRVDISLFISVVFLIHVPSFQSQAFFSSMQRCTACSTQQQQANLAQGGEVEAFYLKAINTNVKVMNSGLENHTDGVI